MSRVLRSVRKRKKGRTLGPVEIIGRYRITRIWNWMPRWR